MEFVGELVGTIKDIATGKYNITFQTSELPASVNEVKGMLRIRACKAKKKRSLNANAYAWEMMSQMAKILGSSSDEVYEEMLLRYGHYLLKEDGTAATLTVLSDVDIKRMGIKHARYIGTRDVGGKEFCSYIVIKGSSEYDTREMASFIDGVVTEASELGIDTIPTTEIEKMKEMWNP